MISIAWRKNGPSKNETAPRAGGRGGGRKKVQSALRYRHNDRFGQRAPSSVVEHVTFNHGVPGSIPGGPTSQRIVSSDFIVSVRFVNLRLAVRL